MDLWPPEMRAEIEADAKNSHGLRLPPSPELLGITDWEMADWVRERVTPHPLETYTEAVPQVKAGSNTLECAYISCTQGPLTQVFGRFAEKARQDDWIVREIATLITIQ